MSEIQNKISEKQMLMDLTPKIIKQYEKCKAIGEKLGYKFNAYPEQRHFNITMPNADDWFYGSWNFRMYVNMVIKLFRDVDILEKMV